MIPSIRTLQLYPENLLINEKFQFKKIKVEKMKFDLYFHKIKVEKILLTFLERSIHDRRNRLRKNYESTCCPRGKQRISMKSIDIYIGHDSSLVVCFSNIQVYFA